MEEKNKTGRVVFYGDSNTYGYDPAGFFGGRYPRQYRWTAILKDKLAGEWEVAADGMPGRAIPPKGRAMEYLLGSMRSEMPVDLFAVMLGTSGALFLFGMFGKRLNRIQGALLLSAYIAYTVYLVMHHA